MQGWCTPAAQQPPNGFASTRVLGTKDFLMRCPRVYPAWRLCSHLLLPSVYPSSPLCQMPARRVSVCQNGVDTVKAAKLNVSQSIAGEMNAKKKQMVHSM